MTDAPPSDHPDDHDLLDLAHPYALNAVTDVERDSIDRRLETCDADTRRAFDQIVRDVREAMGALSSIDAQAPPAELERRILDAIEAGSERGGREGPSAGGTGGPSGAAGTVNSSNSTHTGDLDDVGDTDNPTDAADTGHPADASGTTDPGSADTSADFAHQSDVPGAAAPGNTAAQPDELTAARNRRRKLLRWATAAAAVAVVAAIGAAVLGQRTEEPPAQMVTADQVLQQPDARTETSPVSTGGTLVALISDELGAVAVSFDAVAPPPDGYAHQLWLIGQEGVPRSAGVLSGLPTPAAPYVTEFSASDQLALTVEPQGGSPEPTTDPLAALPLT